MSAWSKELPVGYEKMTFRKFIIRHPIDPTQTVDYMRNGAYDVVMGDQIGRYLDPKGANYTGKFEARPVVAADFDGSNECQSAVESEELVKLREEHKALKEFAGEVVWKLQLSSFDFVARGARFNLPMILKGTLPVSERSLGRVGEES